MRLALLLAVTLAAAPVLAQETEPAAPAVEVALPAITVSQVETRTLTDHVLASGLIAAVEEVSVAPLVEGQPIEALFADVGEVVTAGQVLAKLSTATWELQQSQLKATLASAQTQAAEAKKTADRSDALLKQGATSVSANDQARAALIAAQAQVDTLMAQLANVDLMLSRTEIKAPVSGVILTRNAQVGAVASAAGGPLFVLIKEGALELRADVAEGDMPRLAPGMTAKIQLAADVAALEGSIRLIEPGVDSLTRMGRARIAIEAGPGVHTGMYAEANIVVASRETTAVPVTAIGSEAGETTVMAVKDGVVHRTVVTTGIREGGWVEITSGLAVGDQIVTRAGSFVADGDKINPVPATN
ncbi:efflux RND transporter periplasmic adaptor subunit [Stagnihabitans tardus]|uniref:Efflux RND transporter periplasmic adaptor subunit n=1 Tax=Stagnihabitans tardus TaxID=2699202 RepID=A0AAE4YAK0_9RHOB|nr:efflux RND transporter periplasmic adaptor subunit [Stagnihabitans tardus]NBZ86040.1 efflux RND transporter periplasmic adaptor subunit [Stagnihabitans tardus]